METITKNDEIEFPDFSKMTMKNIKKTSQYKNLKVKGKSSLKKVVLISILLNLTDFQLPEDKDMEFFKNLLKLDSYTKIDDLLLNLGQYCFEYEITKRITLSRTFLGKFFSEINYFYTGGHMILNKEHDDVYIRLYTTYGPCKWSVWKEDGKLRVDMA